MATAMSFSHYIYIHIYLNFYCITMNVVHKCNSKLTQFSFLLAIKPKRCFFGNFCTLKYCLLVQVIGTLRYWINYFYFKFFRVGELSPYSLWRYILNIRNTINYCICSSIHFIVLIYEDMSNGGNFLYLCVNVKFVKNIYKGAESYVKAIAADIIF